MPEKLYMRRATMSISSTMAIGLEWKIICMKSNMVSDNRCYSHMVSVYRCCSHMVSVHRCCTHMISVYRSTLKCNNSY